MRLAEAHERLAGAGEQAARLAAANDELARANRALIAAIDGEGAGDDPVRTALEAELEAQHAARAAEGAQMSEILDALDRMLGVTTTPRSHSSAARGRPGPNGRPATDRSRAPARGEPTAERASPDVATAADETPAVAAADSPAPDNPAPNDRTPPHDAPRDLIVDPDPDALRAGEDWLDEDADPTDDLTDDVNADPLDQEGGRR